MRRGLSASNVILGSTALVLCLTACGSDGAVAPKGPTPAASAEFFDSIYAAYLSKGTPTDSGAAYIVASVLEFAPAYGARRSTVQVTTAAGVQNWPAFTFAAAYDAFNDSGFTTIAYSDDGLTNVLLIAQEEVGGTWSGYAELYQDSLRTFSYTSTVSGVARLLSVGGACGPQAGLRAEAIVITRSESLSCRSATYNISATVEFQPAAGLGALQTVSISNASFDGPFFMEP
jgi:hypothetical protein